MLLALNKKQNEKIENQKRLIVHGSNSILADKDPDFIPSDSESVASSRSEASDLSYNSTDGIVNLQNREHSPKVIVLSNVVVSNNDMNQPTTSTTHGNSIILSQGSTSGFLQENDCIIFITEILYNIIVNAVDKSEAKRFTKKGEIRKRKQHDLSQAERKRLKLNLKQEKHKVKEPCVCKRTCKKIVNKMRQEEINTAFWKLNANEQKNFILNSTSQSSKKRKTTDQLISRRSNTNFYFLKDSEGCKQNVCKVFFLGTLGYEAKNDRVLRDALSKTNSGVTARPSEQGKKGKTKIDRDIIMEHIESFRPTIAHYRREHAPERRYLPTDVNITLMYQDFKTKYPNCQFSYYLYREVVSSMKISFAKLGHEQCWVCESFDLHSKLSSHKKDDVLDSNCEECSKFVVHKKKYTSARKHYQADSSTATNEPVVVSADLQKVILSLT